ncbi:DNA-binding protein [Intrasporangium oryzae NRRL B-24470]|uniref:DNA-binding protein n=1 Tax=Intrasporangium oryzae NRRL B-24470 TaxID=1386089 RepID=W9GAL7_9MICO|nr:OB-fold nucleic acid binding domain-containing protein [Intrasporangium oryzae]EWT01878.1 DNA-binding protein [Intrasporangium oryzae NRRL B-24470]
MTDGRPGVLRRLTDRVTRTSDDLHSAELRRESRDLGVVHIGDLVLRSRATVRGEVRSVTLRPRVDVPALDVELWDGTGTLHLVWLGRRRIVGIAPGVAIQATGRATRQRHAITMFNPAYEIIGRPGQSHG